VKIFPPNFLAEVFISHIIKPVEFARPTFAGEVSGIDLTRRLTDAEVAAIHAGMDRFGVLVFHDQHLDDEQQISFSRQLGELEQATGDIMSDKDRRLSIELNDISNLDKHGELLPRDMFVPVQVGGKSVTVFGSPMHLSATPVKVRGAAPELGQHNQVVYLDWLGIDSHRFEALSADGTI
jgi:hypothetical protein